jgi:hypothetical protein
VENFLVNSGGTMDLPISIEIASEYLKFKVNADICFINNFTKHLNINAMEFFKF